MQHYPAGAINYDPTVTFLEQKIRRLEHRDKILERKLHGLTVKINLSHAPSYTPTPPATVATTQPTAQPQASTSTPPGWWISDALCVHSHEGTWTDDTGNGYYGGMQFSLTAWQANGGTGMPNEASPSEQLQIAYNYWRVAGWAPWPNTSAMCGL